MVTQSIDLLMLRIDLPGHKAEKLDHQIEDRALRRKSVRGPLTDYRCSEARSRLR